MRLRLIFLIPVIFIISGCALFIRTFKTHQEVKPEELGRIFAPAQLKADLNFMFETMEAVHPNLYAYTQKAVIQQELELIKNRLNRPMSRLEYYREIAPVVAMLREGHTGIYIYEEWNQFIAKGGKFFPFDLEIQNDRTYIKFNYLNDNSITPGMELLAINGKPIQEIVAELIRYISAERLSRKYELLENSFSSLLWLIYEWTEPFEISIKADNDSAYTLKVPCITIEEKDIKFKQKKKDSPIFYNYNYIPEVKAGLIDFRQLSYYDQFNKFLGMTFTQMKIDGAENLIIDIRRNPGGDSRLGDLFLTYLTDKPVAQASRYDIKVSKQIKRFYLQYLRWYIRWLPLQWLHPFGRKLWGTPEGHIATFIEEPKKHKPNRLMFHGNIFVLISNYTFSSATMFACTIKDFKIGTLIGEETGGLATGYGDVYSFDLPNTRIPVGVSYQRFVRPNGQDDGCGVLPEYEVSQTKEDTISGKDTVLEFTKQLINKSSIYLERTSGARPCSGR